MTWIVAGAIFTLIVLIIMGYVNSKKTYACPNCGHIFKKKWYTLIFISGINNMSDGLKLKCPACKVTDICSPTKQISQ